MSATSGSADSGQNAPSSKLPLDDYEATAPPAQPGAQMRSRFFSSPAIKPHSFPRTTRRMSMEMACVQQAVYIGIQVDGYDSDQEAVFCLCSHDGTYPLDYHEDTIDLSSFRGRPDAKLAKLRCICHHVLQALQQYMHSQHYKVHAVAIGRHSLEGPPLPAEIEFATRIWFQLDAVPVLLYARPGDVDERASSVVRKTVSRQFPGSIFRIPVTHRHEVEVDNGGEIVLCSLRDYERTTPPAIFQRLLRMAEIVRNKKLRVSFFSSTMQGGGVALMRHALLRLASLLGLDFHWYVAKPKPDVFDITKRKFHNILQ
ncbi:hypothetical protein THASP1DRAFT_32926, partial [Thamnocephalis sphaerospora]